MKKIYLDDIRTPVDSSWIVVRSYDEFVDKVKEIGFENIELVSLDHDLGDGAMDEYHNNVAPNYKLDYENIKEKTGYDCAKWLCEYWQEMNLKFEHKQPFPEYIVHSFNPIGKQNIISYIENFKKHVL